MVMKYINYFRDCVSFMILAINKPIIVPGSIQKTSVQPIKSSNLMQIQDWLLSGAKRVLIDYDLGGSANRSIITNLTPAQPIHYCNM